MTDRLSYIDGLGRVTVVNGLAHLDLMAVIPPAQEGGQPQVQVAHRLVLALPQFVRLCADMAGTYKGWRRRG